MPPVQAVLLKLGTDKRFWKILGSAFVIFIVILTAVGTSCTAHNLQFYASSQVATDFMPLIDAVNNKLESGQEVNTQLLYAAYITLFDNAQYSNKEDVRKRLIRCFYTETTKKVEITDENGKPVKDKDGKKKYMSKKVANAITDNAQIFNKIEDTFNITIDETKRQYIINLSQILIDTGSYSLSGNVSAYEAIVSQSCSKYGIPQFTGLVLAIMQNESGGTGNDPMQCSESPLNKKYPQKHNGITDPNYSIDVGVRYFESCLRAAKCKSPNDTPSISLALQGYNFGGGYIDWALKRGGYTQQNAIEFSQMKAAKMHWSSYGDTNYVNDVLRYYNAAGSGASGSGILAYPIQAGKYTVTSPFGYRPDPITGINKFHKGIDFAAPAGTPIYAGETGTVLYAKFGTHPYGGYGNVAVIRYSSSLISLYGHCSKLLVSPGQTVQKGQVIALVGTTGNSTGNHCHFEVRVNNKSVDPMQYLK